MKKMKWGEGIKAKLAKFDLRRILRNAFQTHFALTLRRSIIKISLRVI